MEGIEKIIVYDKNENSISDKGKETSRVFSTNNDAAGFLKEVFWSKDTKSFFDASVIDDPNGQYFIRIQRAYESGLGISNTVTSPNFTPYDIPPVVTLTEPANFAKVTTFTPEFAWDGVSVADVSVNYEIRLSAKNTDPVKSPEIIKPVGSVERFFNSGGALTLEQLPYYWCVRAFTVKDGKQVAEAFSEVKSFEVVGPDMFNVTGRILENGKGLSGITVTLKGVDTEKTAVTGSDGSYTFPRVYGGSYTVTPVISGYTLSKSKEVITVSNKDFTVPDFTATKIPKIIAISGIVTENGTGLSGVTVALTGVATKTYTTQSDGKYSFAGLNDGTYTVTPTKTGYTFSPPFKTFTNAATDQAQNFTGYKTVVELLRIDKDPNIAGQYWFYGTTFGIQEITEVHFFVDSSNAMNMSNMGSGTWRIPIKASTVTEGQHTARVKALDNQQNNIGENTMQFTRTGDVLAVTSTSTPAAPMTLTATATSSSQINLAWKDISSDEEGFRIERKQGTGSYTEIGTVSANVTAYSATGLSADTEYTFRVRAYNGTLYSGYSNEATARTLTGGGSTTIQGITFVSISGGTFQMGQSGVAEPVHSVTVSSFQMSEAEITNAQHCAWLNAAIVTGDITATSSSVTGKKGAYSGQEYIYLAGTYSYPDARCWIKYASGAFTVETGKENYPVVWVTWYGSKAFAEYYGWDLAREAEWEYACRGGKQYEYGTDDGTISSLKANYYQNGPNKPVNVKSYPKNPFGLYDMSGNVWEWCSDWYGSYSSSPATDPTGAQTGSYRVVRGGGWVNYNIYCRSAYRNYYNPFDRYHFVGFRVVRR